MKSPLFVSYFVIRIGLIIDLVVETGHILFAVIGYGDAGPVREWHLEVGAESFAPHGKRDRLPRVITLPGMSSGNVLVFEASSEEISDRYLHTGTTVPVP